MKTVLTDSPEVAAEFIKNGGLVAFPTETVYGLGANIFDEDAVRRIFVAKRRPADNPLIAHVGSMEQIGELAAEVPDEAAKLIEAFFPGPLTVVLPRSPRIPLIATAGLETVGVRMPGNETAHRFLKACGTPVAAPSANISGRPSPTTWRAVYEDLDGRIDCILQGEATRIGLESTVVDCTTEPPLVLRAGAVSLTEIKAVLPDIAEYVPVPDEAPRSPGLKHRHYSPAARVVLLDDIPAAATAGSAFIGLSRPMESVSFYVQCENVEEYARRLFEFFRECDRRGITEIYCEPVPEVGIGRALMDRLRRAAAG